MGPQKVQGMSPNFDLNPFDSPVTKGVLNATQNSIYGSHTDSNPNNVSAGFTGNSGGDVALNALGNTAQPAAQYDQQQKQNATQQATDQASALERQQRAEQQKQQDQQQQQNQGTFDQSNSMEDALRNAWQIRRRQQTPSGY